MKTLDRVLSADKTATKYVVEYNDELIGEVTYIKYPNKDVVCVPTQVACKMGCKFCHLTNNPDLANRNLASSEMVDLVSTAIDHVSLLVRRPLLVSFMGSGEPMLNWRNMLKACYLLEDRYGNGNVRFAFATMMPRGAPRDMLLFTDEVWESGLNLKMHLSLHFADDETRLKFMPSAASIQDSLGAIEHYIDTTHNDAEIHYTLIDDVNDGPKGVADLARIVRPDIGIKVLHYSQNPKLVRGGRFPEPLEASQCPNEFVYRLREVGYKAEYYKPNGLDIGSSCGQFDISQYRRKP